MPFMTVVGTEVSKTRCVLCQRRQPELGNVCGRCRDRLDETLADIPRKYGPLVSMLVPSAGEKAEGKRGKRDAAPLPLRVDVLNVIGPSNPSLNAAAYGEGVLPTLEVLSVWEHRVRVERSLPRPDLLVLYGPWMAAQLAWVVQVPVAAQMRLRFVRWLTAAVLTVPELRGPTVRSTVAFLRKHADWICEQDWAEPFAREITDAHNVLRDLHGEHRPKPIGTCPEILERDGEQAVCGTKLWASTYSDTIRCRGCGRVWERSEWRWMGRTVGLLAS